MCVPAERIAAPRHKRGVWGLALAALILLLLVLPTPGFVRYGAWEALGNAVHVPLMAAFTLLLFLRWRPAARSGPVRYGAIALGSAATVSATGNNVGYTGELGEPTQHHLITSAWWQWTAPASGSENNPHGLGYKSACKYKTEQEYN